MNFLKKIHYGLNCDRPETFVACQWQRDKFKPNVKYLIYKWILAAYFNFVVVLSFITAENCKQLDFYGIYLTNWNVLLNGCSSLFAAILVTLYYRKRFTFDRDLDNGNSRLRLTLKIFWVMSTLSTAMSISLCCVYWPIIYVGRDDGLNDSLTHGGNAIVNLIDLFIHAHPTHFGHVLYVLTAGIIYVIFSVIYTLAGGTDRDGLNYIYSVIDWKNNTRKAVTIAFVVILFLSLMHFLLAAFVALRIYVHKRFFDRGEDRRNINQNNIPVDNFGFSG